MLHRSLSCKPSLLSICPHAVRLLALQLLAKRSQCQLCSVIRTYLLASLPLLVGDTLPTFNPTSRTVSRLYVTSVQLHQDTCTYHDSQIVLLCTPYPTLVDFDPIFSYPQSLFRLLCQLRVPNVIYLRTSDFDIWFIILSETQKMVNTKIYFIIFQLVQ